MRSKRASGWPRRPRGGDFPALPDHRQRRAEFVRYHAHKLSLMEAGFTLNLQLTRQALLLLQLAVFSAHPQDSNDQHRNDVDDQRILPEGIDRHMERDYPVDRQLHQHRGGDVERRQQTQQQSVTVDGFCATATGEVNSSTGVIMMKITPSICIAKP